MANEEAQQREEERRKQEKKRKNEQVRTELNMQMNEKKMHKKQENFENQLYMKEWIQATEKDA